VGGAVRQSFDLLWRPLPVGLLTFLLAQPIVQPSAVDSVNGEVISGSERVIITFPILFERPPALRGSVMVILSALSASHLVAACFAST